jgi:hypothetical protein
LGDYRSKKLKGLGYSPAEPPHEKIKDEYWLIEGLIKEFAMLIASRIAAIATIQATFRSNVAWMKRSGIQEVMSIANSLNFMRWPCTVQLTE